MQPRLKWLALLVMLGLLLAMMASAALAAPLADADGDCLDDALEIAIGTNPNNWDTDGDGLSDGDEYLGPPSACDTDGWITNPLNVDTDGDGLEDGPIDLAWPGHGFDGLTEQTYLNTRPDVVDSDGDGMPDGWEAVFGLFGPPQVPAWLIDMYGYVWAVPAPAGCGATDPTNATDANQDSDTFVIGPPFPAGQDGLNNLAEFVNKTNPCDPDTDRDGFRDGVEVFGTFGVVTDPNDQDTDKDGLCDGVERNTGLFIKNWPYPVYNWFGGGPYNPAADQRIDGAFWPGANYLLPNGGNCAAQLVSIMGSGDFGSNPANADTDGDGIPDGLEVTGALNWWGDPKLPPFVFNPPPGFISDPNRVGATNPPADMDGDGVDDGTELRFTSPVTGANMDPTNPDTDGDGIDDAYEYARLACGFDPTVPDAGLDYDGDGLTNYYEYLMGMEPCDPDTDGDGIDDYWEDYYRVGGGEGGPVVCTVATGGMNPIVDDAAGDVDGDWASNLQEYLGVDGVKPVLQQLGDSTIPCNVDTDGDKFDDGYEYVLYNSSASCTIANNRFNPAPSARGGKEDGLADDYDNDGLANGPEYQGPNGLDGAAGTQPIPPGLPGWVNDRYLDACNPDSDGGGALDGWEYYAPLPYQYDPNDGSDDLQDHDLDGIPTMTEDRGDLPQGAGSVWWAFDGMANETDFADPDTDGDRLCDGNLVVPDAAYPDAIITGANPPLVIVTNSELWLNTVPMTFICKLGEDMNNPFRVIAGDTDGDRFWDVGEIWTETDPRNPDTDYDGLNDGDEVIDAGTNPLDADTDDDQLDDHLEWAAANYNWMTSGTACRMVAPGVVRTSPTNPDSDGDGLYDGFKGGSGIQLGKTDGTAAVNRGFLAWLGFDGPDTILGNANDQPGEDFRATWGAWSLEHQETNPCLVDSDFDGVSDGVEYSKFESPLYRRTQPNWNGPGALIADTNIDGDGIRPALDNDSDGDSLCDGDVKNPANQAPVGFPANPPNAGCFGKLGINTLIGEDVNGDGIQGATETHAMNRDSDGDAVWDGVEVTWYETFDCGVRAYRTDLLAWDCDGDGLRNALDWDSDSDGLADGWIDQNGDGIIDPHEGEDYLLRPLWVPPVDDRYNGLIYGDIFDDPLTPTNEAHNRIWACGPDGLCGTADDVEVWAETDPLNFDTDGDGLSDGYERANGFDPLSAVGDFDNDGLSDADEIFGNTCGKPTDPKNPDTDGDNWSDGAECDGGTIPAPYPGGGAGQQRYQTCDPLNPDTDGDGLTDWEEGNLNGDGFLDPAMNAKYGPFIGDGFVTDCRKQDTDDGGVTDDIEYILRVFWRLNYNPQNGLDDAWDSDRDGLTDGEEVVLSRQFACLSPLAWDSDGDFLNDRLELFGTFKNGDPWLNPPADPCNRDTDGDLVEDGNEYDMDTDPTNPDTDGDGLPDGIEVYLWQSNPRNIDTDGDGLPDGWIDGNGNGVVDPCEGEDLNLNGVLDPGETSPVKASTNGIYPDGWYCKYSGCLGANNAPGADPDGDGLTNAQEAKYNTNPCSDDTDGDGLKDKWEVTYMVCAALDPVATNNAGEDPDADGLTNLQEQAAGANPCNPDTDGDGLKDGDDPWPLSPDGDGDGMPDAYEVEHPCLDPLVDDADGNPDGDAYTNIEEYQMGTDPCTFNCFLDYDWDQDNEVTVNDVLMMVPHWQETPASPNWVPAYDVDGDKVITVIDFMIVVNHIGETCLQP